MGLLRNFSAESRKVLAGTTLLFLIFISGCASFQTIPADKTVLIPADKMRSLIKGQVKYDTLIFQSFKYRTIQPYYVQQIWQETDLHSLKLDEEWYVDSFMCGEFSVAFMNHLNIRRIELGEPRWAIGVIYLHGHTQICFLDTLLRLWLFEPQNGTVSKITKGTKVLAIIF